jgi:hypothetical protein
MTWPLALPFSLAAGPLAGYNITLLLSFVLSGVFMYAWVARLTESQLGGLIARALFAFSPYCLAYAYGHWPLMGTQYLVVYFNGLLGILSTRGQADNLAYEDAPSSSRDRRSRLLEGGLGSQVGSGPQCAAFDYYQYMTLVVSVVIVVGYHRWTTGACWRARFR